MSAPSERLHVNWTRCDARGTCLDLLPELLAADDWGYPRARSGHGAPVVPASSRDDVLQAVRECPRTALRCGRPADELPAATKAPDRARSGAWRGR